MGAPPKANQPGKPLLNSGNGDHLATVKAMTPRGDRGITVNISFGTYSNYISFHTLFLKLHFHSIPYICI
jgi:hypothetical protein